MAGSEESGEEVQSGRTNRAENRTRIWAQRNEGDQFDGDAIFVVESAGDIEDDDFSQVPDSQHVHGIMSSGCGHGAGVVGFARRNPIDSPGEELSTADVQRTQEVGVFGKGVTGIVGQGDSRGASGIGTPNLSVGWGAGVIGRGGKGLLGTAGVMGFAGDVDVELSGGETGVFGQGSTGVKGLGTSGPGVRGIGSDLEPGVIGVGGTGEDRNGNPIQGTGVVGIGSGDDVFPPYNASDGTGVLGVGRSGVHGVGFEGRGGIFASDRTAQVQLVPVKVQQVKERPGFTPITSTFPELPKAGLRGDLMSVVDNLGQCTLWFCVSQDAGSGAAQWAQVRLGDLFNGTT